MTELTTEETKRREILLKKFKEQKITKTEAEQLRKILEKEKEQAEKAGDSLLVFGLVFVLGLLISYLADRKFDPDLIKKDFDNFFLGNEK